MTQSSGPFLAIYGLFQPFYDLQHFPASSPSPRFFIKISLYFPLFSLYVLYISNQDILSVNQGVLGSNPRGAATKMSPKFIVGPLKNGPKMNFGDFFYSELSNQPSHLSSQFLAIHFARDELQQLKILKINEIRPKFQNKLLFQQVLIPFQ